MIKALKDISYNSKLFRGSRRNQLRRRGEKELLPWAKRGFPFPPPHIVKQYYLRSLAKEHSLDCLVETGTYLGDMVFALEPYFSLIHSIEVDKTLFKNAKIRLAQSKNIVLHQGDSGSVLEHVLSLVDEPCLVWLDGHYSGKGTGMLDCTTPIIKELHAIKAYSQVHSVIAIDDMHCFNGTNGYPSKADLIEISEECGFSFLAEKANILTLLLEKDR